MNTPILFVNENHPELISIVEAVERFCCGKSASVNMPAQTKLIPPTGHPENPVSFSNTMNTTTPVQFANALIAQTMSQNRCDHSEASRLVGQTNRDAMILAQAFGKPEASVAAFNALAASRYPGKAEDRAQFANAVQEEMKSTHCNYEVAFNRVSQREKELSARLNGKPQFANLSGEFPPVFGPQLRALFRLPQTCSQDACHAAWRANGNQAAPFNPAKVFDGIVKWLQVSSSAVNHLSYETALSRAQADFSELWQAVKQLAAQPV
jgi:hypothetical protein